MSVRGLKKKLGCAIVCASALLLGILVGYGYWRNKPYHDWAVEELEKQLGELREKDVATSLEEVRHKYQLTDTTLNGGPAYMQGFSAYVRASIEERPVEEKALLPVIGEYCPSIGEKYPEANLAAVTLYLQENAPALEYIQKGAAYDEIMISPELELTWPPAVKNVINLNTAFGMMGLHGAYMCQLGNQDAVEVTLLRLANAATAHYVDPICQGYTVTAYAMVRFAWLLDEALHRFRLTPETLRELTRILQRIDGRAVYRDALSALAALSSALMQESQRMAWRPLGPSIFVKDGSRLDSIYFNALISYSSSLGYYQHQLADFLYVINGLLDLSHFEWNQAKNAWPEWESHHEKLESTTWGPMSGVYQQLPQFRTIAQKYDALSGTARLACAAELIERNTGALPLAIDDIAIISIPANPYSGEELHYARTDNGYAISGDEATDCEDKPDQKNDLLNPALHCFRMEVKREDLSVNQ